MPLPAATRARIDRIDGFVRRVSSETDDYQLSIFAKWLVMLTAGFAEKALQDIISAYVERRANKSIAGFSSRQVAKYLSINSEKLHEVVGGFSSDWTTNLKSSATESQFSALNSVKSLRDLFAHGGENGIGWTTAQKYWTEVKSLMVLVDTTVNG